MIKPETIDRLRTLPIYEVLSHWLPDLKKNGSTGYKCKSPFGDEKTPSFYVVTAKNIFKDFSTGLGGDSFRFVMEYEKCSFVEAIEKIAKAVGEQVEYERPATEEEKQRLTHLEELQLINRATCRQYVQQLINEKVDATHPAFQEIDKRRYTPDTIAQWQLGYAPNEWKFLTTLMLDTGKTNEGLELGLIKKGEHGHYDVFRHRLIYPIHDHRGVLVTFAGRYLGTDKDTPKYINGYESPLYQKQAVLYGLNFAQHAIRKHEYAYLVEGYADVVSLHQVGFDMTVGTCGTALTEKQCELLKRYCSKVVLFPDPDKAGEQAAQRNIHLLMQFGFEVHLVPMPHIEGRKIDPDELTRMTF